MPGLYSIFNADTLNDEFEYLGARVTLLTAIL